MFHATTTTKKKLSFAEMAAAGTSITVSSLPSTNQIKMPILEEKLSQSLPSAMTSRIGFISSNTTASTDENSTSSSSSESVSHKPSLRSGKVPSSVPKPAAAPLKNPWNTESVKKTLEGSIASIRKGISRLPTPAESNGMRSVDVASTRVHIPVIHSPSEREPVERISRDKGLLNKESEIASAKVNVDIGEDTKPSSNPPHQRQETTVDKERPIKIPNAAEKPNDKLIENPFTTAKKQPKDESSKNQQSKNHTKKKTSASQYNKSNNNKKTHQQNKNKGTKKKKQNKRNNQKKVQATTNVPMYTPTYEELAAYKIAAVKQVEYFFSTGELIKNIFMRNQMDVEGYLPAAIVFNFPSVLSFSVPYYDMLEALKESKSVQVDYKNECLRLKGRDDEYKRWLFPNGDGTYGCPKWFIPQEEFKEDVADEKISKSEIVDENDAKKTDCNNMESAETGKEEKMDPNLAR